MTGISRQRAAEEVAQMFGSTPERLYDYYDTWAVEDTEGKKWKFMYDSSITAQRRYNGRYISAGDEYKTEMVSPKLEYGEMEKLQEVVRCLKRAGAKVNHSCGMHVHVDASNHTPKSLKNALSIMYSKEDILFKALNVNPRRVEQWFKKVREPVLQKIRRMPNGTISMEKFKQAWYERRDGSGEHISDCGCKRKFSQPDCNWGWDSSRNKYFFGYHLYMFVAADSENDLPVFPMLERASRHDMLSFLHTFFSMKSYLPEFHIEKLLLDSAHDAYPLYEYCKTNGMPWGLPRLCSVVLAEFSIKTSKWVRCLWWTGPIRDEGFSYHYIEPSRCIFTNPETTEKITQYLENHSISYIRGLTWTTDAIFRETADRIVRRKQEGAKIVEMKQAGCIAVSQFRGFEYGALIYGGDDVSQDEWSNRGWRSREGIRYDLVALCKKLVEIL